MHVVTVVTDQHTVCVLRISLSKSRPVTIGMTKSHDYKLCVKYSISASFHFVPVPHYHSANDSVIASEKDIT